MKRVMIAVTLLLGACSGGENVAGANRAIAQFHERLNSGQFQQIYRESDTGLKRATSEPDMIKLLSAIHSKLGAFRSGSPSGWKVNYNTSGNNTVVQVTSTFEKGKATETFTFVGNADAPRLFGYYVDSPTLITG